MLRRIVIIFSIFVAFVMSNAIESPVDLIEEDLKFNLGRKLLYEDESQQVRGHSYIVGCHGASQLGGSLLGIPSRV